MIHKLLHSIAVSGINPILRACRNKFMKILLLFSGYTESVFFIHAMLARVKTKHMKRMVML